MTVTTRKKRITISCLVTLSLLAHLLLSGCEQQQEINQNGQSQITIQYDGTIIAVGDSLTAGIGVAETAAWPSLLKTQLNKNGHNWQVINAGISGETSSGTLSRIRWIIAQNPDIVILETGANDGFRGIPTHVIKDNINKTVTMLLDKQITLVLAGMQIVQNFGPIYTSAFAAIYPDVAKEQACLLIPFFLKQVAAEPSLNQADMIHPNEKGHKIIVETVYPFVMKAIEAQ